MEDESELHFSDEKRKEIWRIFRRDPRATEFMVNLVWVACRSYRHDTVLRPFPNSYVDSRGQKDHAALRKEFDKLSMLTCSITSSKDTDLSNSQLPTSAWDLLGWLLLRKPFSLREVASNAELEALDASVNWALKQSQRRPSYVFAVEHSQEKEDSFYKLAAKHGQVMAFHGSKMENFYSILHNGFLGHLNKTSLYGEGTYFSTELSVAMNFSPGGPVWSGCGLHPPVSCVAVCALVDHTDVRCSQPGRSAPRGGTAVAGEVPEKYYVVGNNDHILLKYILVYETRHSAALSLVSRYRTSIYVLLAVAAMVFIVWLSSGILRHFSHLLHMKRRDNIITLSATVELCTPFSMKCVKC